MERWLAEQEPLLTSARGLGGLLVTCLGEEVKKTHFSINMDQLGLAGEGNMERGHAAAALLGKAERVDLLVPDCRGDISFHPKNANL